MFKWIRWLGLIPFAIIIGAVALFFLFFSNNLIKSQIETHATQANAASVDVASVRLTLQPIGFEIRNMQVANPDEPMRNLIEFERAAVQVDLLEVLLGRVIIEEVSFTGVKYDTERRSSGFIPGLTDQRPVKDPDAPAVVPALGTPMPTLEEILGRQQPLLVVERAEALQASWQSQQKELENRINALPGRAEIEQYQQEMQALRDRPLDSIDNVRSSLQQLDQVQQQVVADGLTFAQAKIALDQALNEFEQGFRELASAPAEDWQRIVAEFSLDEQGLRNALAVIFGPEAEAKIAEFEELYQQLQSYLAMIPESEPDPNERQRLEGRFVSFPDPNPNPSFLLKLADFDLQLPIGQFAARLTELTNDQSVRQIPTRFELSAVSDEFSDLFMDALFDRRSGREDRISLSAEGWQLLGRQLLSQPDLAIEISDSLAQLGSQWRHDGLGWQFNADLELTQSRLQSQGTGLWQSMVADVFNEVTDVDLQLRMGGGAYSGFELDSNLDDLLASAAQTKIDQQIAELEHRFMAEVNGQRAALEQSLSREQDRLFAYRDQFEQSLADYQQQVEEQLRLIEQDINARRNQLEDAADALLREQQENLDRARREAEAEAERLRLEAEAEVERVRQEAQLEAERQRQQAEERARQEAEQRARELVPSDLPRIPLPGR